MIPPRWAATPFALLVLALAGCGAQEGITGVNVSGTVLKGGKPYQPPAGYRLSVDFKGKGTDGQDYATGATCGNDGQFTLPGPMRHGTPPGNYTVSLRCFSYELGPGKDGLGGAFLPSKTPLTYTVTDQSSQRVVIDLDKKSIRAAE